MGDDLALTDSRVEFMAMYLLKSLNLKNDKWMKMYNTEEYKTIIDEFLDKTVHHMLVYTVNPAGHLAVSPNYPTHIKSKSCYFAKKNPLGIISKEANFNQILIYGDLSYNSMQQLTTILDDILLPLFSNNLNLGLKSVGDDLLKNLSSLRNKTFVISGQIKGKTQLPIPAGTEKLSDTNIDNINK
jgi:dynein heavy chain